MQTPELRFKANDGSDYPNWKIEVLGKLGTFTKGAALSKADITDEGNPFVLYGELYTTYNEVAYEIKRKTKSKVDAVYYSKIGDVLIPTSGESAEEISTATCIMVANVILAGDLNIFRSNNIDGRIISYILNYQAKRKIATIAQGKSIVHIQAKQLAKIPIKYPDAKEEQKKIADFLSTIDTVIEKQQATVEAWEQRKKGVMQKLFNQELRFKADDGSDFPDWEEKKLGNALSPKIIKQVPTDEAPLMAFIAYKGVSEKGDRYDRSFLVKNADKKYKRTDYDDFIYSSNNLDVGSIGLNKYGSAVISDVYEIFSFKSGYIPDFMNALIQCPSILNQILSFRQGCLYGQYRIYASDFLSVKVNIPTFPEQQKIADCLSALDDVIKKQKEILEKWKELKKGLLQQMFV